MKNIFSRGITCVMVVCVVGICACILTAGVVLAWASGTQLFCEE